MSPRGPPTAARWRLFLTRFCASASQEITERRHRTGALQGRADRAKRLGVRRQSEAAPPLFLRPGEDVGRTAILPESSSGAPSGGRKKAETKSWMIVTKS